MSRRPSEPRTRLLRRLGREPRRLDEPRRPDAVSPRTRAPSGNAATGLELVVRPAKGSIQDVLLLAPTRWSGDVLQQLDEERRDAT